MYEIGKYLIPGLTYKIVGILNKKHNLVNSLFILYRLKYNNLVTKIKFSKIDELIEFPFITTECMFYRFGKNGKYRCSRKQIVINGSNLSIQSIKKLVAQSAYTQEIIFLEPITNVINLLTCNEYIFIAHVIAWTKMLKHISFSVENSLWPKNKSSIENIISDLKIVTINEDMPIQLRILSSSPITRLKILNRLMHQKNFLAQSIKGISHHYSEITKINVKNLLSLHNLPKFIHKEITSLLNAKN